MLRKLLATAVLVTMLLIAPMATQAEIKDMGNGNIVLSGDVTEDSFLEFLEATSYDKNMDYRLIIHTNGGDAHSTVAIMNRIYELKKRGCTFTTEVFGKAFSAGAYLFLMGDRRIVHEGSTLMYHTMAQRATDEQLEEGRETHPSSIGMIERMDEMVRERFREVTNCGKQTVNYFINGRMPDGSRVAENSQFMSARTALNIGVATEIVEN